MRWRIWGICMLAVAVLLPVLLYGALEPGYEPFPGATPEPVPDDKGLLWQLRHLELYSDTIPGGTVLSMLGGRLFRNPIRTLRDGSELARFSCCITPLRNVLLVSGVFAGTGLLMLLPRRRRPDIHRIGHK